VGGERPGSISPKLEYVPYRKRACRISAKAEKWLLTEEGPRNSNQRTPALGSFTKKKILLLGLRGVAAKREEEKDLGKENKRHLPETSPGGDAFAGGQGLQAVR